MLLAIEQAAEAELANEVPVGAIVVKDGAVVSVGRNRTLETGDPTAHAEIIALRAAAKVLGTHRLDGLEMFVTLEPCPMCSGAVFHSRLSRLVYGAADPKTGCAGSVTDLFGIRQINHHTHLKSGVLENQCRHQLQTFFQSVRRKKSDTHVRLREDAVRVDPENFVEFQDFLASSQYFLTSDGWRLHYIDSSSGDTSNIVLCLHALPYWSYQFKQLLPLLKKAGFRVLMPDFLGCGLSDKPKKKTWHSLNNHVAAIHELLLALKVTSCTIVVMGNSIEVAHALVSLFSASTIRIVDINFVGENKISKSKIRNSIFCGEKIKYLNDLSGEYLNALLQVFPDKGHVAVLDYAVRLNEFSLNVPFELTCSQAKEISSQLS